MTNPNVRACAIFIALLFAIMLSVLYNADRIDDMPRPRQPHVSHNTEQTLICEATAYCLQSPTFTGLPTRIGVVAVDPQVIPLYSEVHIEGYGRAQALDTGAEIRGNRVDIWLPSRGECMEWGRKQVRVRIIREGDK